MTDPPSGRVGAPASLGTTIRVDVEHEGGMLHRVVARNREFLEAVARSRGEVGTTDPERALERLRRREFVFQSDEPAFLGGDDEHPAPLEYFAAGVGT